MDDEALRERVMALVESGSSVAEAATEVGINTQHVWAYAKRDAEYSGRLDAATAAHATCTPETRGAYGYRNGCRCPDCRAGHHAENDRYRKT